MSQLDTTICSSTIACYEWEVTIWNKMYGGPIKNPEKIKEVPPEKSQQIYINSVSHNVILYI